jgi:hypothetical protein
MERITLSRVVPRWIAPSAAVLLALTLTACASSAAPGANAEEPTAAPTTSATAPTTDAPAIPEPTPQEADPASCLVGAWLADNEFYLVSIREYGDEIKNVTGRVTLDFSPDGTLTTTYQDWLITALVEGTEVLISRDGTDAGVFSVSGDTVDLADTAVGSTMALTAAGTVMPVAPWSMKYTGATLTCDPSTANITTVDGTLRLTR